MSKVLPPAVRAPLAAFLAVSLLGLAPQVHADEHAVELESVAQRFSYVVGLQLGQRLRSQGLSGLDSTAVAAGIADVMSDREPQLGMEEMQQAAEAFQAQLNAEMDRMAQANKTAEDEYLAANRDKDGVQVLDSGIQYSVVEEGSGESPSAESQVTVHYRGTLPDGTEFDSSHSRGQPAEFQVGQVIDGWQQVLPLMKEGAKWNVVIPSALAYGERGAGASIGPNQLLLFEIELLEVN